VIGAVEDPGAMLEREIAFDLHIGDSGPSATAILAGVSRLAIARPLAPTSARRFRHQRIHPRSVR
jgi:hypothetical protein